MQDELEEVLDQIWECQGLDPFRDDPVGMVPGTNTNIAEEEKTGIKMLRLSRRRVRALVEIVCTCPHRKKRDCAAGGSWAGNEIINLQVRIHSNQ